MLVVGNFSKMTKFILYILFSFYTFTSFAKCSEGGYDIFPNQNSIKLNSLIIINDQGSFSSILPQITKKYKAFLISGNEKIIGNQKIELILVKINVGYRKYQLILKPSKKLKPNKTYKLSVEGLDEFNKNRLIKRYNYNLKKFEDVQWVAENSIDEIEPMWLSKPAFNNKKAIEYGCGPEKFVNFKLDVSDNSSNCYFNVKLRNKITGLVSEFLIVDKQRRELKIGHGMCSGEFEFINDTDYEATIELYDICGNRNNETVTLKFTSPKSTSLE